MAARCLVIGFSRGRFSSACISDFHMVKESGLCQEPSVLIVIGFVLVFASLLVSWWHQLCLLQLRFYEGVFGFSLSFAPHFGLGRDARRSSDNCDRALELCRILRGR